MNFQNNLNSTRFTYYKNQTHLTDNQKHYFHIVTRSPWPIYSSLGALLITFGAAMCMHNYLYGICIFKTGIYFTIIIMAFWWRDVIREGTFLGYHTKNVQYGLRIGIILFIVSEIMFFFSFFWAFFHSSISPGVELGSTWPPLGINVLNPMKIPFLNTLILLLSGLTVTWSHHVIRDKSWQNFSNYGYLGHTSDNFILATFSLFLTILLGLIFTIWQAYEYYKASFYIYDGVYGSTFYMTTGLHGLHVIIGTLFLVVCLIRVLKLHFTYWHHIGYEAAIWYWHFVDVVWIFLFLSIYCWGSGFESFVK